MTVHWSLCIFFITLLPFLSSGQNTTTERNNATMNTTLCYDCDSMLNDTCMNDSALDPFLKKCEGNPLYCHVTKGMANILVFEQGKLQRKDKHRVVRGCSRLRNKEDCVRVVQANNIVNFTVCNCNTSECNGNSSLEDYLEDLVDSSENLRTSRILAITWLCIMLIGPAFSKFGIPLSG